MPITEAVPPTEPLAQGDILQEVQLFITAASGEAVLSPHTMCLVLSRPCVLEHKAYATVVSVSPTNEVPSPKTSSELLHFFNGLRDGEGSPDRFYLGSLSGMKGRYFANFDQFHSLQLPSKGSERDNFVASKRILRLTSDFVTDLQFKAFCAFASTGFDDHKWFSDKDLEWLVTLMSGEIAAVESKLSTIKGAAFAKEHASKQMGGNELHGTEKELESLKKKFAPYQLEFERRTKPS